MEQFTEKEKSFADRYPDLAAEWHPTKNGELTPSNISSGSSKKVCGFVAKVMNGKQLFQTGELCIVGAHIVPARGF